MIADLHRALVEAIRRNRPDALDRPVTVAEIYQDLVPYRMARAEIGFEMNADYEHTLLRLLAGEGDLARIEPREIRDRLRLELESPNPDVGLYRNYAACDVWISVPDAAAGTAEFEPAVDLSWEEEFVGPTTGARAAPVGSQDNVAENENLDPFEPEPDIEAGAESHQRTSPPFEMAAAESPAPVAPARDPGEDRNACLFCGSELPTDRLVNFCPFCGSDQSQQPCPSCGEVLEPLWRFCVSCGARVRPLDDHVN